MRGYLKSIVEFIGEGIHLVPILHIIHEEAQRYGGYYKLAKSSIVGLLSFIPEDPKKAEEYVKDLIEFFTKSDQEGLGAIIQERMLKEADKCAARTKIPTEEAEELVKCLFKAYQSTSNKEKTFTECYEVNSGNFVEKLIDTTTLLKCTTSDLREKMQQTHSLVAKISKEEGLDYFAKFFQDFITNGHFQELMPGVSNAIEKCSYNSGLNVEQTQQNLKCFIDSSRISSGISEKLQYFFQCENITSVYDASKRLHNTITSINCIENEMKAVGDTCTSLTHD